tara:strand:+ start:5608 stop:6900 length:1293 start_codon:yes stop_codon:yes gene_type:complete
MKKTIKQQIEDEDIYFCHMPWTMVYNEVDGYWQTCCHAKNTKQLGLPDNLKISNTSPEQWMKSNFQNKLRDEMLDPNSDHTMINKVCRRCKTEEKQYGESRRLRKIRSMLTNKKYHSDIMKAVEMYKVSGEFDFYERIIETQVKVFGMECNLDCHMCPPRYSTTRQKTQLHDGMTTEEVYGKIERLEKFTKITAENEKVDMMQDLKDLAPYTNYVKIIGGEPLVMKKQFEYLQILIDTGHSKNINIKYQTNMTKLGNKKHRVIDFIPHFKRFTFTASLDSMGDAIEYCRRRTKWDEVLQNMETVKQYPNVTVDTNSTMGFLSILRFYEFLEWAKNYKFIDKVQSVYALERPAHFQVKNLPQKIKDNLIPKYSDWPHIQKMLQQPNDEYGEPEELKNTFNYLLAQDDYYKGTKYEKNLFEVFPELEEFYTP